MKILIFTEGTVLMHENAIDVDRDERVKQVIEEDSSTHDFKSYVPNSKSVEKIKAWASQGADIHYLTSRRKRTEIEFIKNVLIKFGFPSSNNLHYRIGKQEYSDVAEQVIPDILIEDDCESIGGEIEMTYPHISEKIRAKIKSIVVKEFAGIDELPDDIYQLKNL